MNNRNFKSSFSVVARGRQAGFSMVDLSIWVVVVGVALALVLSLGPSIMTNMRVNAESSNLQNIVACVQKYKFNKANFAGTTTAQVINQGCFPDSMVSGSSVINRWSGAVTVAPVTTVTASDSLGFTYNNLNKASCTGLIPVVADNFLTISVNGSAVKPVNGAVDDNAMGTACNNATNAIQMVMSK